jgi:hypothetical protein
MFGVGSIRSWASVVAVGFVIGACTAQTSPEGAGDATEAASAPPCDGAVLHSRTPYTTCVDGHVRNMEIDGWCCADQTTREVNAVVGDTSEACSDGTVEAAPACGTTGSACDSAVCGAKGGTCKKEDSTHCLCEVPRGSCGLTTLGCYDNNCAQNGGECKRFQDLAACICMAK